MWQPWGKARFPRGKAAATSSSSSSLSPSIPRSKSTSSFTFSSLKDVHSILGDEEDKWCSSSSQAPSRPPSRPPSPGPVFNRIRSASSSAPRSWQVPVSPSEDLFRVPPGEEKRIVLYFTSLGAVRKTSVDCRDVRSIFCGLLVAVDERDLFMNPGYLAEVKGLLRRRGGQQQQQQPALPQVFIGGRHVGGADEIRQLHESGELKRYVEGVSLAASGACEGCGDVRFVLCGHCSGSRKCFTEKGVAGGGSRSCTACNEIGLVRCPQCS